MNVLPLLLMALLAHIDTALTDDTNDCNERNLSQTREYAVQPCGAIGVEICLNSSSGNFTWFKICADDWTITHAKVACRELGLPYKAAKAADVTTILYEPVVCIKLPNCTGTETNLAMCNHGTLVYETTNKTVAGAICHCLNGEERLQPTSSQGQAVVQMCILGTWTTVCRTNCGLGATIGILLATIGILLALLVAIVIGWLCTCVAFKRRNSNHKIRNSDLGNTVTGESSVQDQRELDNPFYDGTTVQPHPPANYSSLGPAYETVEANKGVGHMYDVVNRDADNRKEGRQNINDNPRHPEIGNARESGANLLPDNNLDHTGEQDHHDYHVLEQSSGNEEQHVYHVLEQSEHRNKQGGSVRGGGDPNPLGYEVPTPKVASRGAGKDEEEYSQLKH